MSTYDVIVAGGRVAGATVAALLGERGLRVALVERARFPSSTISTHFFRGDGLIAVLVRLGLLDAVLELGAPPLRRELNAGFSGAAGLEEGPPQSPGDAGFCLSVRRLPLDALLLERASRERTVDVVQPGAVVGLLRDGDRVVGARVRADGHERDLRARLVVGADGRHSLVARAVGARAEREAPAQRTLYYRYVRGWRGPRGEPPDAPEFSLLDDELAYVFPSDNGLTCVAVSAPRSSFPALRAAPEAELTRRLCAHAVFADRLRAATPVGRVEGGPPEPCWMREPAGPGWALVGDAGLHLDPWSGEGMDLAGRHAAFLADAAADWLVGATSEQEARERFAAARAEHALATFDENVGLASDLRALADP
jgi:menaquinone-9 beta-reductase